MAEKNMNRNELPVMFDAKWAIDNRLMSRPMAYKLLNCPEAGAIQIGKRKFFLRDKFLEWLSQQRVERKAERM